MYKIPCAGEMLEIDIEDELGIDIDNLTPDLQTQGALQAWWDAKLADKAEEVGKVKVGVEAALGEREIFIRNVLMSDPTKLGVDLETKKVTESVVRAVMDQDETVKEQRLRLLKVQHEMGVLRAVCKGYDTRTSLLTTLGGVRRAELEAAMKSVIKRFRDEGGEEENLGSSA
jgi:hypothetical protein